MSANTDLSEHWRSRAREVTAMAKASSDPRIQPDLLEIAATYERLANLMASGDGIAKGANGNRSFLRRAQ